LHIVRQVVDRTLSLASRACIRLRYPDARHRRVTGAKNRRRLIGRAKSDNDGHVPIYGVAWA
jgi:hypothetical protein